MLAALKLSQGVQFVHRLRTMAVHQGYVRLMESELRTTEALPEDDFANWESRSPLPEEKKLHPWPYFTKRVMKGSTHHKPQSVIVS